MNKTIKNWINTFIKDVKNPNNIILFCLAVLLISYLSMKHYHDKNKVLNDLAGVEAEIIRFKSCFKNGKCIDFKYAYNGVTYREVASVSWAFFKWCEKRDGCKGLKFKVHLEKNNPENILVYWKEMFEEMKNSTP